MRTRYLGIVGFLILVFITGAWLGISQFNFSDSTEEPSAVEQNKQDLLTGIVAQQPLYFKMIRYNRNAVGPEGPNTYPATIVYENWYVADANGQIVNVVGTIRNLEGDLIGYAKLIDGDLTYTDVETGKTEVTIEDYSATLASIVESFWGVTQKFQDGGTTVTRQGSLNDMTSAIYERTTEKGNFLRTEVVEDAPILYKQSLYSDSTESTLLSSRTLTEYRLLPTGAELPDPAAEASG